MSFLVLFGSATTIIVFATARTHVKASKLSRLSWDDLVNRIAPIQMSGICTVALDYLQPSKGQLQIETDELWSLIGGYEGIRKMYANAEILMALAGYAQRWNLDESTIVIERMRRDASALRRATLRLSMSVALGIDRTRGPFSVQEAASAYYLMRERLLALYQTSHAGRYPKLAAIL